MVRQARGGAVLPDERHARLPRAGTMFNISASGQVVGSSLNPVMLQMIVGGQQ
jgi:hypothetical protein